MINIYVTKYKKNSCMVRVQTKFNAVVTCVVYSSAQI